MVEKNVADQWEWEPLLEAALRSDIADGEVTAAWNELENWWQDTRRWDEAHKPSLKALLEQLRSVVPTVIVENGMERATRHLQPSDPTDLWAGKERFKPAAEILHFGELEAVVDGEPEKPSDSWSKHREMITKHLNEYLHSSDPTSGDASLSRRGHASSTLELLFHMDVVEGFARHELTDETDHVWLTELVAEIAFAAFEAGRHTQAAWGKEFEKLAVVRVEQVAAFKKGSYARDAANREKTEEAALKQQYARQLRQKFCGPNTSNAECARRINKNWDECDALVSGFTRPKPRTIEDWFLKGYMGS